MAPLLGLAMLLMTTILKGAESINNDCDSPKDQTGMSGTFASHATFPQGTYRSLIDCQWIINVPPGYFIRIHFDSRFNIEMFPKKPYCRIDYITFERSGTVMKGPFCGKSAPPDFSIYHRDVTVRFKSDSGGQLDGFSLTWTAFSALLDSGCGSPRFQSGVSGKITSMYYPDKYENNARSDWVIRVPVGYRIKLHFDSTFDLENEGGSCKDYVTILRTDKTSNLCNPTPTTTTAPNDITSWSNDITVKFQSNSNARRKGFSITWISISAASGCGQVDQTGISGSFSSMNYTSAYDAKAYCFWRITVADGYRIRLHFDARFNTEKNYDMVAIHEESSGPVIYGPFSGTRAPADILSMDKDLTVVFTSDGSQQREGFQITWTAIKVPVKFGPNNLACHCMMGAQCDTTTGVCPNKECAPGWSGDNCQTGNAALGQPATQSSSYATSTAAGRAVDGGRDQGMDGYSCTHTKDPPENQPWWRVDLGKRFFLFSLTLYNRAKWYLWWGSECPASVSCNSQLGNLVVWMSDVDTPDPAKGRACATYTGLVPFRAKQQLNCSSPVIGRYLFIKSLNSPAALSLCEVVTNAVQYKDCTGQHFGPGCKHRCRCEDRTEQCNSATGACVSKCIYDYDGEDCDKLMPFMKQTLTRTSRTGSSIKVSTPAWSKGTDGGDGTVLKYMLQYKRKDASQWTNYTQQVATTASSYSWDVTGLSAVTAYQFRVVLLNKRTHEQDDMLGRPGPVLDANTPCPAVVKPKIKDITTGIDPSATWPNRAYLLVKIDNFIVAGMPTNCFKNYFVKAAGSGGYEVRSSTTLEYKLQSLKPHSNYVVYITLYNIDGKFAGSDHVTKRTAEDMPGEVSNLAATQQGKTLRVTWSEPTLKNGIITGYFFEHKLTGYGQCRTISGSTIALPTLAATTRSHDLKEDVMCAYCRYDITVKASTSAGIGKPAGLTNKYTAAAVPTTAPSTPTVESKTSRQVVFKWNAPACRDWNGPDGKYYYLLQQNVNIVKTGPTPAVRVQIDGLSPYTSYSFKIALQNSKGTGPYSPEVTVTTGEEAPGQVASMSVETFATSIKVKWTPPSSPNGLITHYRLGLKHTGYGPVSWACTTGVSSAWVYKVTTGPAVHEDTLSTCAYCMYDVKVQAVNRAGAGAEKTVTGILTKASAPTVAPPNPRETNVKSREVTFTWNAMPCQNRNGASMKYPFRLTTLNGQVKEAGVRDSTTSVTLTGLIPYVTYKFQIAFGNEAGTGPYGGDVSVTTDEEKPRAPSVKKAGAQLDSISVTVTPPDPPHGKITKYTIEMWLTTNEKNVTSVDVAASNNTRKFDKLTPITNYTFKAKAWTKIGDGGWSSQISIKTIEGPPGYIASMSVEKFATSINVKWTSPSSPNGLITHYRLGLKHLRYGPVSWACTTGISSAWVYKDTTGPVQEYTLSTCPYCMYDVKVQAVNGTGVGAEKTTTGILTKASAPTSAPPAPRVTKVTSRELSFAWDAMPCQNRNGVSMKYPFRLTTLNGQVKKSGVRDSTTFVTLTGLIPYVTYKFQIAFRNEAGTGPYGVEVSVTTEEEVPRAPGIARLAASLTTVSVNAVKPNPPHGIITYYSFEIWKKGTTGIRNSADILPKDPSHTFSNLNGHTWYKLRAKAWTKKGAGVWSREIDIITVDNVPGAPASVSPLLTSTNSFLLKWTPPKYNNGVLKNYELRCSPLFSYDPAVNKAKDEYLLTFDPSPTERKKNVTGLRPATEYNCSITAQTSKGYGPSSWLKVWTKPNKEKIPEHLFLGISPDQKSDTTITVEVKKLPATLTAGKVSALRIGVEKLEPSRRKKRSTPLTSKEHNQISDYKTAKAAGHMFYIAAELNTSFVGMFVIGDGNAYGGYYNAPLDKGMTYDVIFGLVITAGGVSTTTYSRYGKGIVVGHKTPVVGLAVGITIGCLVLLVAIIVPIVVIKRRKNNASASNEYEMPIPMETPQRTNDADENPYDDLKLSDDAKPSVEETEYYVLPGGDGKPTYENVGVREPEGEYQEINISGGVDNPGVVSD